MDTLTHGLLGAACAHVLLSGKNRDAWIAGGLAAMAPDLDVLIQSASDPLLTLRYHRQFSHAFIFIPFGAALVTLVLMLFKSFRSHWSSTFLAALIGYATHGVLDALTTYGTVLYWPFSNKRISGDIVSIIDPFVSFPLLLGLVWTAVHKDIRGTVTGLGIACLFLSLNLLQHERAWQAAESYAQSRNWKLTALRTFPKFASSTHWRAIGIVNDQLMSMDIRAFFTSRITNVRFYPLFNPASLPDYIKNSPTLFQDYQTFHWFSDGYLVLLQTYPLILSDGLFLIDSMPGNSIWNLQFSPNHPHAQMIRPL